MAVKISELTASAALTSDDFFPVVDSGSLATLRASAQQILDYVTGSTFNSLIVTDLTSSNLTGNTAQFVSITGSHSGSGAGLTDIPNSGLVNDSITVGSTSISLGGTATTIQGISVLTGSTITGSTALFTTVSASRAEISGNLVIYGSASFSENPDYAYVLYNSTYDKIVVYPGLYVSGNMTGSGHASLQSISGTTAQFTTISGSVISASQYVGVPTITPGGINTTVQFNSGSTFSGSTNLVYNYTTNTLSGTTAQFTRITGSGLYITGNVGINVQSSNIPLDMYGVPVIDGDNRVILEVIDTTNMTADVGAGFTFGGKYTTAGGIAGWAGIKGIKENNTDSNLDASLVFMTRKTGIGSIAEKMRITSDGNVGIGTASPTHKLTVVGAISASNLIISNNSIFSGSIFVSGSSIYGQVAELTSSTDSYTLLPQDSGKFLNVDSGSAVNVNVPAGLPAGFTISVCQLGSGSVTFVTGSGVTINNRQGHTKTAGQYAVVSLVGTSADTYVFLGDTSV